MGLGAVTPAHRGALLWLLTWHCCCLPLAEAQTTASGAEDAGVLLEAKAAADTSACNGGYVTTASRRRWSLAGRAPRRFDDSGVCSLGAHQQP